MQCSPYLSFQNVTVEYITYIIYIHVQCTYIVHTCTHHDTNPLLERVTLFISNFIVAHNMKIETFANRPRLMTNQQPAVHLKITRGVKDALLPYIHNTLSPQIIHAAPSSARHPLDRRPCALWRNWPHER